MTLNRSNLHTYQQKAVDFICEKQRCALWVDMGLGKTISSLTALVDMLNACTIRKALVIAPLRVCNSVWRQEASKWVHTQGLNISLCTGTLKERKAGLNTKADVYIINRENVKWLVDIYIEGKKPWDFDAVVIDEASSFRDSGSKRFKALKKVIKYTTVFIELTGTPAPNGLIGLFAQMFLIDFGSALGKTKTGFLKEFFTPDYMGYNYEIKPGSDEVIYRRIGHQVLSMEGSDYLELPDRIDVVENVELPQKLIQQYEDFESKLFLKYDPGVTVDAINAAVLANKLLQFANGAIYYDEDHNWIDVHDLKLDALSDLIDDNPNENILVAYNYKHDLGRLKKRFPHAVVLGKDPKIIDRWNDGKIKLLLAHPGSAGHGVNLQHGGSLLVWFGMNWSLELDQQMNARLHRQGQSKPVRIIRIVTKGTIDERVLSVLGKKDAVQSDLLTALK